MALPKVTEPIAGQWPVSVAWRGWLETLDRRVASISTTTPETPAQYVPELRAGDGLTLWNNLAPGNVAIMQLALLADSGVGAGLVKITRDEYGRVEGTQAATTDDLTEGATNLYHTPERVRDVMGAALVAGSNVTITVNDPGDTITIASTGGGGGSGSLIKLGEVAVTSAATDIDFTGLDLDTHAAYQVELSFVPNATGDQFIRMFYNSDTTDGNYQRQQQIADGTGVSAFRDASALITVFGASSSSASNTGAATIKIAKASGRNPSAVSVAQGYSGGSIIAVTYAHKWSGTANVTAIKLRHHVTNGFGVGTLVRLYRLA